LTLGIEEGIGVGVLLSIIMVVYSSSKPHVAELGRLEGTQTFRNLARYDKAERVDGVLVYRFDSPLFFGNSERFGDALREKMEAREDDISHVMLDFASIHSIDSTGTHALETLVDELQGKGIGVKLSGVIGPVRDILHKTHVMDLVGEDHFYFDVQDAMDSLAAHGVSPESTSKPAHSPAQANGKS
jgi:SulP family sulfate permease